MNNHTIIYLNNLNMSPVTNTFSFNFKFAFTDHVVRYTFDKNMRMEDFIADVENRVRHERQLINDQTVVVVEAGQPEAEMASGIIHNNMTLNDKYSGNHQSISFYIRVEQ